MNKFVILAIVFTLAACGDDNNANNNRNNNTSNNGTTAQNGTTAKNDTTKKNGTSTSMGTTASTNGLDGPTTLRFVATMSNYTAPTKIMNVALSLEKDKAEVNVTEGTDINSGDVGVSLGKDFYYFLDRGNDKSNPKYQGKLYIYKYDGTLEGTVDITGNIHDAVDAAGKIFVTTYNTTELQVVEKNGTSWELGTPIELTLFNEFGMKATENNAEVHSIVANKNELLVGLQLLDDFVAIRSSKIAVVDATTGMIIDQHPQRPQEMEKGIVLMYSNMQSIEEISENTFGVASVGAYGDTLNAGIEILTKTGTTYEPTSLIGEDKFKGDLSDVAFVNENTGYATAGFPAKLYYFEADEVKTAPGTIKSDSTGAIAFSKGYLIVASFDNAEAPEFHVYNEAGDLITKVPFVLPGAKQIGLEILSVELPD